MKLFQNIIRSVILAGSIGGFLGGWALFAHSGKPVDAAPAPDTSAPAPVIQPLPTLPPLNFNSPSSISPDVQPLPSLPPVSTSRLPRMRTRGS